MKNIEQPPALQPIDYAELIRCLDEALAVYDRRMGKLNLTEIRAKTMLGVLRSEMQDRLDSCPPFNGTTAKPR